MYLNLTDDFKKELENVCSSDVICIRQGFFWLNNIILPSRKKDKEVDAWFKVMSCEKYWSIEKESEYVVVYDDHEIIECDRQTMRRLFLRYGLKKWSLPIELTFDNEDLDDESMEKISKLPAPFISALLDKYEDSFYMDQEEKTQIEQQATRLFAPHSHGIENACEAVSLYCNLSNFWDKFGLNRDALKRLPYKDFVCLRMMISKEQKATSARVAGRKNNNKSNVLAGGRRVAGLKTVPDTFQDMK